MKPMSLMGGVDRQRWRWPTRLAYYRFHGRRPTNSSR